MNSDITYAKDKDNKKCAIVNYWWSDGHGAVLTAVALAEIVRQCGYTPWLIKTPTGKNGEWDNLEEGRNYKFASKYVNCAELKYRTYEDYKKLNDDFDTFILGSDQVFRLEWVPDEWFFNAIKYNKNLIAVSASFGINKINNSKSRIRCVSRYLDRFNAISLREKDGINVYKKYFGERENLAWVIDPVYLVDKKFYESMISEEGKEEEPFLFFYFLDRNEKAERAAEELQRKYNCKIVWETPDTTAEDFLYYMSRCKMVVTDSFHGSSFSVIFNKPFYCLLNEKRGIARIESLKELCGLDDAVFVSYENIENVDFAEPNIDYERVNKNLEEVRRFGREWIKTAVVQPYKKPAVGILADEINVSYCRACNKTVGYIRKIKRHLSRK